MSSRSSRALIALLLSCSTALVACGENSPKDSQDSQAASSPTPAGPYAEARSANQNRNVDPRFPAQPTVIADANGLESAKLFFDKSDTAVISAADEESLMRAASIAVTAHAPVFRYDSEQRAELLAALEELGAKTILLVGEVEIASTTGERTVIQDPGTTEALTQLTATHFDTQSYENPVKAVAELGNDPTLLSNSPSTAAPDKDAIKEAKKLPAFPIQSRRDADAAPVVIASPESDIIDVANARSYGAEVRFMDYADPRLNHDTMDMVAGLADKPLLALGSAFGSGELLADKIRLGEEITTELPGGGGLVFPGRRMIALYGHPTGPALGAMGDQDPEATVARLKDMVAQYQPLESQPVIPAVEVMVTVASEFPGEDGNYSNEFPSELVEPYIDAVVDAGGYAVIDLQPGRSTLLEQAKLYEDLLSRPNVGLALDPEWRIGPDEKPLQRVGHVEAQEVNEVSEWLANLVREKKLPQKALILHQFQVQMLRDREQIRTDYPELAFVLHADGHGVPEEKFDTWNVLRQGLSPDFFMAWKNFYDEDSPTFTPEQTYAVEPRPWFVSYQ